jgi:hypothetical protein
MKKEALKKHSIYLRLNGLQISIFVLLAIAPMASLSWMGSINLAIVNQNYTPSILMGIGFFGTIISIAATALYVNFKESEGGYDLINFFQSLIIGGICFVAPCIIIGFAGSCMGLEAAVNFLLQNPEHYYKQTLTGLVFDQNIIPDIGIEKNVLLFSALFIPIACFVVSALIKFGTEKCLLKETKTLD